MTSDEQAKDHEHTILTCPVCFEETQDSTLEAFNRHIDNCLSGTLEKGNVEIANSRKIWEKVTDLSVDSKKKESQKDEMSEVQVEAMPTDVDNMRNSSRDAYPELQDDEHSSESEHNIPADLICGMHAKEEDVVEKEEHFEENNLPCFSDMTESKILVCPVCNSEQKTKDLVLFNRHVDICLNKGIIKQLTEHSKSVGEYFSFGSVISIVQGMF